MTGWMLITLGFLTMATLTAFVWHATEHDHEYLEQESRRRMLKELAEIELHRPEHLMEHHERPDRY